MESNKRVKLDIGGTPYIPNWIFEKLPKPLHELCSLYSDRRQKDVALLANLLVFGGALTNVVTVYNGKNNHTNLFLLVLAPFASGKGVLEHARYLLRFIDEDEHVLYELELEEYNSLSDKDKKDKAPPSPKILLVPADSSSASLIAAMKNNDGVIIVIDSEADTLSGAMSQDWGNFSPLLRKGFHYESISKLRQGTGYARIPKPIITMVLSGTPRQATKLIASAEDGLFSRFLYYTFAQSDKTFKNMFQVTKGTFEEQYEAPARLLYNLRGNLKKLENPIQVIVSEKDQEYMVRKFQEVIDKTDEKFEVFPEGSVYRLGDMAVRIMTILTILRLTEKDDYKLPESIEVCRVDVEIAVELCSTLFQHALLVYSVLPSEEPLLPSRVNQLFQALPKDKMFKAKDAVAIGKKVSISERSVFRYLDTLVRLSKLSKSESGDYKVISE